MGSSLSAISDDIDTYNTMCTLLGIESKDDKDMYTHMGQIYKAFRVQNEYGFFAHIEKVMKKIEEKAFQEGVEAHQIKELVKDRVVEFDSFRQGVFFYKILGQHLGDEAYTFPVPQEDIGTASMLRHDKAITFMRWIRKAIDDKTLIKVK